MGLGLLAEFVPGTFGEGRPLTFVHIFVSRTHKFDCIMMKFQPDLVK